MTFAGPSTRPDAVVITGIGPLAPWAMDVDELRLGAPGSIAPTSNGVWPLSRFDVEQMLGRRGHKYLTPATRYALAAASCALADARVDAATYQPEDKGVALGTNFAVHATLDRFDRLVLAGGPDALQPMDAPNFSVNLPASHVSIRHTSRAFNITLTSLLVAGLESLMVGARAIRTGRAQMVLAGAAEGRPPSEVAPLLGGSVAEGAACILVLESCLNAVARGARIYAELANGSLAFVPRGANAIEAAAVVATQLDQILRPGTDFVRLCLLDLDFDQCRAVNDATQAYLTARGVRFARQPGSGIGAPEASVAPLLWLARLAAEHAEGLAVIVSPHGQLAMVRVSPVMDTQIHNEKVEVPECLPV